MPADARGVLDPAGRCVAHRGRTARRVLASAATLNTPTAPSAAVDEWIRERQSRGRLHVEPIPFSDLQGWDMDPTTGVMRHRSGRFFTVEGVHVTGPRVPNGAWAQPIIVQPEVGVLGLLAQELDGVLHVLIQAKMEPGNADGLQLSPTVQATRSNSTGAHHGRPVRYFERFVNPAGGEVLLDVLQSEQAEWFLAKQNRNMLVEVPSHETIEVADDFCWVTVGQLARLLSRDDDLVNMDTRSILACLPSGVDDADLPADLAGDSALRRSVLDPTAPTVHETEALVCWVNAVRSSESLIQRLVPLTDAVEHGWTIGDRAVSHRDAGHFRVVATAVNASSREVGSWDQPLIEPTEPTTFYLVVTAFRGVLHALVQARVDVGQRDLAELAPTVQARPSQVDGARAIPYLDAVLAVPASQRLFDSTLSEEGGRFLNARNRYVVVDLPLDVMATDPEGPEAGHAWMSLLQLNEILRQSNVVNVELRTLVSCVRSLLTPGR